MPHILEQFVSDHFRDRAIPTEQEISEIEIEKDTLDKPDTVQVIRDPAQIQDIAYEIGRAAKDEILIIYSSANAFQRQEKLGAIKTLRETAEKNALCSWQWCSSFCPTTIIAAIANSKSNSPNTIEITEW